MTKPVDTAEQTPTNITPDDRPPPPEAPEAYECCDSGCGDACVFEIYRVQKAEYDAKYGKT